MNRPLAAMIALLLSLLFCLPCQAQPRSKTPDEIKAAAELQKLFPDRPVEVTIDENTRTGEASGVSGESRGENAAFNQDTTPPGMNLGGDSATGGGGKAGGIASIVGNDMLRILVLILGGLYLAAAAVAVYFRWNLPRGPIVLGVTGLALIVLSNYLTVLVLGLMVMLTYLIVNSLLDGREKTRFKEALRAVAAGVADLRPDAQAPVLESIGAHSDEADKATIKKIKKDDDL